MAFYWYQSDPDLYRAEVQAMNKFFPSFMQAHRNMAVRSRFFRYSRG